MSTIIWIAIGVIILLGIATPQGRQGIRSLVNTIGSLFGEAAESLESPASLKRELEARVEAETRAGLTAAEAAYTRAQSILNDKEELERQLKQWEANRDEALRQANALMGDATPDVQQSEELGRVKSIGQTALNKIAGIQASMEGNVENYQWAEQVIAESEELFRTLPEIASQRLREGDVAAATMELAQAQKMTTEGLATFSDSKASKMLNKMKDKALEYRASASASKARAIASPASADVAAKMLQATGSKTTDFDALLNESQQ